MLPRNVSAASFRLAAGYDYLHRINVLTSDTFTRYVSIIVQESSTSLGGWLQEQERKDFPGLYWEARSKIG